MTDEWRLIELDALDGIETQTIYHAVGLAMEKYDDIIDTVIICWPKNPLVCVGYHQIIDEEVNTVYCKRKRLPIVRRVLGGGAVYLDSNQLFYQLITLLDNPKIPRKIADLYRISLKAPIETYREIGINANYAPINDIEANGKKISGNGAAEIEGARILTGNLIFDFNYNEMVKILKVPNEKFRDKVARNLTERLGTIKQFLENPPKKQEVKKLLIKNFEKFLDVKFTKKTDLSIKEKEINDYLKKYYTTDEWLNMNINRRSDLLSHRKVKISASTKVYDSIYKAPGGLIRIFLEIFNNKITDIIISGDFSTKPLNAPELIENALKGSLINPKEYINALSRVFQKNKIEIPGVTIDDFVKSIELSIKDIL